MRFDYDFTSTWRAFATAGLSHSLIDDNVVYAYGTPFDNNGNVSCANAPNAPAYFFCPDGTYGIYDYRDPGELRIDAQAEALLVGSIKTGPARHDLAAGAELFHRSVQQPGYFTTANPSTAAIADGSVYDYIGADNIYAPNVPASVGTPDSFEYPRQYAGPRRLWEDNHQSAALMQDRIHLPGRIELLAAARYDSLRDHNYSIAATSPGTASTNTDKPVWLPQYAATFSPMDNLMLYGNYGVVLSLGPQAPWWAADANQFLNPYLTRQAEIGAKYNAGSRILLSTAFFRMRAPFFYPKNVGANAECEGTLSSADSPLCFLSQGHETHDGIELNAQGKATGWLQLNGSAAAMNADSNDTGTPAFDNRQVLNVPHLRTTLFADMRVSGAHGLHLMPGWSYTGRKEATRDDRVSVSGYNLFNMGARYTPGGENGRVTLRVYADNILDKRYWKDTGASLGDTFIHLGAPTTVKAFSALYVLVWRRKKTRHEHDWKSNT